MSEVLPLCRDILVLFFLTRGIDSGRFAPVMFMFDKVGRVQVRVPEDAEERDSRIEAILEAASAGGGEDFEVIEDTDIVEVRNGVPPWFCLSLRSVDGLTK